MAGADRVTAAAAAAAGVLAEVGVHRCCRRRRVSQLLSSWAAPSTGLTRPLDRRSAPEAKSVFKKVYFALFRVLFENMED